MVTEMEVEVIGDTEAAAKREVMVATEEVMVTEIVRIKVIFRLFTWQIHPFLSEYM